MVTYHHIRKTLVQIQTVIPSNLQYSVHNTTVYFTGIAFQQRFTNIKWKYEVIMSSSKIIVISHSLVTHHSQRSDKLTNGQKDNLHLTQHTINIYSLYIILTDVVMVSELV